MPAQGLLATIQIVMDATDIVRLRRRQARQANRPTARLLRAIAAGVLLLSLVVAVILTTAVAATSAGLLAFWRELPDVATLSTSPERYEPTGAGTRLYARGGTVLIDEIGDPRQGGAGWLALANLPAVVIQATLAAEDPSFLSDPPLDPVTDLQAWWPTGGFPRPVSPFIRQLIEAELASNPGADGEGAAGRPGRQWTDRVLAWQIEQRYGRERILEWVLNTRYYGHLAYGIEAAARVYFDKPAADLSLGEAALLAAVGRDSSIDPFDDLEAAREGQAVVLAHLVAAGEISAAEATAAGFPVMAAAPGAGSAAPHFARLARAELEQLLGPRRLLQGGLAIETTLDPALQHQAACAMTTATAGKPESANPGGGPPCPAASGNTTAGPIPAGGAVVALDPTTGAIEALWSTADTNDLSLPPRPTGSLVRPFIYLTALSRGYSAASLLLDVKTTYLEDSQPYTPRNTDGKWRGPLRLRQAAAGNLAVPAAEVLSWIGVPRVLDTARALGVRLREEQVETGLAFAEEGFAATLLDLVHAFGAVDQAGRMAGREIGPGDSIRPATIARIMATDGEELYRFNPVTREILAPELAFLLTDILADETARCQVASCSETDRLAGGQRAARMTTESAATGDAWTIGYTPERVIGIWLGAPSGEMLDGRQAAAPLWRALMDWSRAGAPPVDWQRPRSLLPVEVCVVSGLLPRRGANCPTVTEWFVPGTEPVAVDTMIQEVAINRETGRLATIFTPPDLIERRTFIVYPAEAAEWAAEAGIPTPPLEYDPIPRIPTRVGDSAELFLVPWSTVSGQVSLTGTAGGDDFAYYRLAYFPGLLPEAMQTIVEPADTPVTRGELGVWDTTTLTDGLYTVLLTVGKPDGTFAEVAIPVTVDNND